MLRLGTFYLVAFAVSAILTPLCRHSAHLVGCVAKPKEDRWHRKPTALFGGVAIAVTTIAIGLGIDPDRHVWLVDERTGAVLSRLYPLDKARNADGFRGVTGPPVPGPIAQPAGIAPLLRKLMTEYAATGLPPAYIPKEEK